MAADAMEDATKIATAANMFERISYYEQRATGTNVLDIMTNVLVIVANILR